MIRLFNVYLTEDGYMLDVSARCKLYGIYLFKTKEDLIKKLQEFLDDSSSGR